MKNIFKVIKYLYLFTFYLCVLGFIYTNFCNPKNLSITRLTNMFSFLHVESMLILGIYIYISFFIFLVDIFLNKYINLRNVLMYLFPVIIDLILIWFYIFKFTW